MRNTYFITPFKLYNKPLNNLNVNRRIEYKGTWYIITRITVQSVYKYA